MIRRLNEFADQGDPASIAIVGEVVKCESARKIGQALHVLFDRNQRTNHELFAPAASLIHPLV